MSVLENGTNGNGFFMPVAPAYGGGYGNGGFGMGNDGGLFWLLVLFLFGFAGNWGGGFGGGNGAVPMMMNNTQNDVQRGFDQQAIMTGINGINNAVTTGFGNVQNSLCNGFAQAEIAANSRQMADMNQAFAAQTAMSQGLNAIQSQLAQCCCDNRLATAQTQAIVQSENCADRQALSDGIRDLLTATQNQTQTILNQLCNDKIEQKNDLIAQLRSELMYARGQASQDVQTAAIQAGQRALANEVEQYVAPRAIPSYTVQNPNCCAQTYACGCGVA